MRDDVDHALREPELLHARVAAVRRGRRLVRARLREVDAHVAPAVAARRHLRPDDAAERLVAREGACVVERLDLEAEHRAVGLHRHLDVEERSLVPVGVRGVLVGAPLRPLDGAVELPRQQAEGDEVRVERDLVAEPTADVLRDDAELVGADAQRRGHPDDPDPGHLVVAVQRPLRRAAVVLDEGARAFERRRGEAVEVEAVDLDDVVGLGQRLVEVAPLEGPRPDDVRARPRRGGSARRARPPRRRRGRARAARTRPPPARPRRARARASRRRRPPPARRRSGPCRLRARSRGSRSPAASTSRRTGRSAPRPPRRSACRRRPGSPRPRRRRWRRSPHGRTASGRNGRSPCRGA